MPTISEATSQSSATQPVKDQCSVSLVLEGREVDGSHNGLSHLGGLAGHVCAMEFVGTVGASVTLGCEHPSLLRCGLCGRTCEVRCRATRDDKCAGCAERHGWDVAREIRSGVTVERLQASLLVVLRGTRQERRDWLLHDRLGASNVSDRPSGFRFVTLTAPGREPLPFDRSICGHEAGECSNASHKRDPGDVVCKVERFPAARWNGQAPRRWNDWITDLRRVLGVDVQYCGSWETQVRGVLHRHVLVWAPGVTEKLFRRESRRIAIRLGFGRQYDVRPLSGSDTKELAMVAGYIASYVTKCGDELATCINPRTGEIVQGSYRRWSASRKWGVTMGQIRAERVQWVMERATASSAAPAAGGGAALDSEQEIYASADSSMVALGAASV